MEAVYHGMSARCDVNVLVMWVTHGHQLMGMVCIGDHVCSPMRSMVIAW